MQEQFEEARSIRRKTRKGGKSPLSEAEKCANEKARLEREIEEINTAIAYAQNEAENYNAKLKKIKSNLREILYNSELELEEKARRVADLKNKQTNCEFIWKQAVSRWASLTDKKNTLEKALREVGDSK